MTELYIFDQDDKLLTILSEETGLISAPFREELNQVSDTPFSFTVEADVPEAKYVKNENQVVFRDKEGDLRLYVIKELDDTDSIDGPETTATCEPEFMELAEHIVVDRRMVDDTADVALDAVLEGTRYVGEVEVDLGLATTNFYYIDSVEAIWKILDVWGGDFKDVVEFDDKNNIVARKIKLLQRRGVDNGHRWEIDHNIEGIQRTVLSYPITALYGRGASLETESGGHTRYIDFGDVEWKKTNGDPVDKPLGQKWIGDPDVLQKYGRIHEGKLLHREGIVQNQDIEDPKELLKWTWEQLPEVSKPEVNYSMSVHLLEHIAGYEHEKASLGDTSVAIDRNFSRAIEIQARIIAMEYDLMDIEGTAQVEMGQFLKLSDERLDRVIEDINDNRGNWEHVTENNYPDKIPHRPTNVEAIGGFQTIQIYWDYTNEIYVKNYEVYGSQVKDFVPDSQHLLWRGDVSGFSHVADTDETWYYRVRAVNYHGTPGDWSVQVEASTVRIMTPDILFGEVIADHLEENLDLANKLSDGTLDWINETPMQEIRDTSDAILEDVGNRIGSMSQSLSDLAKSTEDRFVDVDVKADETEGLLKTTIQDLTDLDGELKGDISSINQRADEIETNVQETHSDLNELTGEVERVSTNVSDLSQRADRVEQSVTNLNGDLNDLSGEMTLIDQKADKLNLSVSDIYGDIDNIQSEPLAYLDISRDGVRIDGDKIALTGQSFIEDAIIGEGAIANAAIDRFHLKDGIIDNVHIADATIESSKIKSVDADKINAADLSAVSADLGTITGGILRANNGNVEFHLNNSRLDLYGRGTQSLRLDDSGLTSRDDNGNIRIHLGIRDIAGKGQSSPSTIRFFSGSGSTSGSVGMNANNTFVIGSQSSSVDVEYRAHEDRIATHYGFEIRLVPGRNPENYFRVQRLRTGGDNDYQPGIRPDVSGVGYMGTSSYRLWRVYTNYIHYYREGNWSKRELKENIQDLTPEFSHSVFNKLRLRSFNYKRDGMKNNPATEISPTYGLIYEEAPKEITDDDGMIVVNNFRGIIAGELKHQQQRVNNLERKIKQLEEKIS